MAILNHLAILTITITSSKTELVMQESVVVANIMCKIMWAADWMLFAFHNQKKKSRTVLALGIGRQNEKSQYFNKLPDINQLTSLEVIG